MSRLTKREIKDQRDLYNLAISGLSSQWWEREEQVDKIYENFHPSIIDNQTENGAFYTPYGLAQDCAVFTHRHGHIVDVCAGIGMMAYRVKQMDSYDKKIKSITCIELNPKAVEIGKKLLPEANWICGNVFDLDLWQSLTKDLPDNRFDIMISNPPFGKDMNKRTAPFLNMSGERDLMVLELALRYAKGGYFILPSGSVPFKFSGERYYKNEPDRWMQRLKRFIKVNEEFKFNMVCDGIDTSIYKDDWKGLNGISVEAVDVQIYPWSLDYIEDALCNK